MGPSSQAVHHPEGDNSPSHPVYCLGCGAYVGEWVAGAGVYRAGKEVHECWNCGRVLH